MTNTILLAKGIDFTSLYTHTPKTFILNILMFLVFCGVIEIITLIRNKKEKKKKQ